MSARAQERMLQLFERKAQGDENARNELILKNLGLASYLAKKFIGMGEPFEDLLQVATIGLINAVDRFNPYRGIKFSTFAVPTIVGEIRRYFRDKGYSAKIPRHLRELALSIKKVENVLSQDLERTPTIAEIADFLNIDPEEILDAYEAKGLMYPLSLDEPIGVREKQGVVLLLEDAIGVPDPEIERIDGNDHISNLVGVILQALSQLDERSQRVINLRFLHNLSQTEVAALLRISQMHVSRIQHKAIARIRTMVKKQGIVPH